MIFKLSAATLALLAIFAITPASAQGQNVRGTLTAFDGKTATVKTRAGDTVEIEIADTTRISTTKTFTTADIKPGMMLGVTTVKQADGSVVAIDVRPIPATAKQGLSFYAFVEKGEGGTLKAIRTQVSKDGVKPTQ